MHEFSLAETLLRQVLEVQSEHPDTEVVSVCVQVGPLSGVEDCLLQSAFEQYTLAECGRSIELVVEHVPLSVQCKTCCMTANLPSVKHFFCPHCASRQVCVTSGDALTLVSVDLKSIHSTGAFQ